MAKIVCIAFTYVVGIVCNVLGFVVKTFCTLWLQIGCAVKSVFKFKRRRTSPIKHIFVLMLENRSFDHMLGSSNITATDVTTGQTRPVNGIIGQTFSNIDPRTHQPVLETSPAELNLTTKNMDPGHEFADALEHLCGAGVTFDPSVGYPDTSAINNSGFFSRYLNSGKSDTPQNVMHSFGPDQVPVIKALAAEFAVCDKWFSALPGPTWPNRFFIHAATSGGLDGSPSSLFTGTSELIDGFQFENGSIFDRLEEDCLDWFVFSGDELPQCFAISGTDLYRAEGHFRDFEDFHEAVNDPHFKASYVFIEPNYGNLLPGTPGDFTCGNSQHPLDDVTRGEKLIKSVYETIRNSPHWNQSMLLVVYDEHGGFFDHVVPDKGTPPGDVETYSMWGFDFSRLGVRVPAVVASPWIPKNLVDGTQYDHTSLLATVERILALSPMTARDKTANPLSHLFSLTAPRTDAPTAMPEPHAPGFTCTDDDESGDKRRRPPQPTAEELHEKRKSELENPVPSHLFGFVLVAARMKAALSAPGERTAIMKELSMIRTEYAAKTFISDVRKMSANLKIKHYESIGRKDKAHAIRRRYHDLWDRN